MIVGSKSSASAVTRSLGESPSQDTCVRCWLTELRRIGTYPRRALRPFRRASILNRVCENWTTRNHVVVESDIKLPRAKRNVISKYDIAAIKPWPSAGKAKSIAECFAGLIKCKGNGSSCLILFVLVMRNSELDSRCGDLMARSLTSQRCCLLWYLGRSSRKRRAYPIIDLIHVFTNWKPIVIHRPVLSSDARPFPLQRWHFNVLPLNIEPCFKEVHFNYLLVDIVA